MRGLGPGDLQGFVSSAIPQMHTKNNETAKPGHLQEGFVTPQDWSPSLLRPCPLRCRLKRLTKTSNPAPAFKAQDLGVKKPMKSEVAPYKCPSWMVPNSPEKLLVLSWSSATLLEQNRIPGQVKHKVIITLMWLNPITPHPAPLESCG